MQTVVAGYVPTPEGEAVIDRAIRETQSLKCKLVVVHIPRSGAAIDETYASKEQLSSLEARIEGELDNFRVLQMDPASEPSESILDAVEEYNASLVVIGLRKRSTVGKLVLGSIAQRVLLRAECDILCVRSHG